MMFSIGSKTMPPDLDSLPSAKAAKPPLSFGKFILFVLMGLLFLAGFLTTQNPDTTSSTGGTIQSTDRSIAERRKDALRELSETPEGLTLQTASVLAYPDACARPMPKRAVVGLAFYLKTQGFDLEEHQKEIETLTSFTIRLVRSSGAEAAKFCSSVERMIQNLSSLGETLSN